MQYRDVKQELSTPHRDSHKSRKRRTPVNARPVSPEPDSGDEIVMLDDNDPDESVQGTIDQLTNPELTSVDSGLDIPQTPEATPERPTPTPDQEDTDTPDTPDTREYFDLSIHVSRLDFERERARGDRAERDAQAARDRHAALIVEMRQATADVERIAERMRLVTDASERENV